MALDDVALKSLLSRAQAETLAGLVAGFLERAQRARSLWTESQLGWVFVDLRQMWQEFGWPNKSIFALVAADPESQERCRELLRGVASHPPITPCPECKRGTMLPAIAVRLSDKDKETVERTCDTCGYTEEVEK